MRPRATEALEGEVAWMQVTGVGDASPFDEERELMREGEVESRADPSRPTQLPLSGHRQIACGPGRWRRQPQDPPGRPWPPRAINAAMVLSIAARLKGFAITSVSRSSSLAR